MSVLLATAHLLLGRCCFAEMDVSIPNSLAKTVTSVVEASASSEYIFRGERLSGAAVQSDVDVAYSQYNLGLWGNFPLKYNRTKSSILETDFYGSADFNLSSHFQIETGTILYARRNLQDHFGRSHGTVEPYVTATYTGRGIRFTAKMYYDLFRHVPTAEVGAIFAFPLARLGTEMDFHCLAGAVLENSMAGPENQRVSKTSYGIFGLEMPFQLHQESKILVGFDYTTSDKINYIVSHFGYSQAF